MKFKDYYRILGVERTASDAEIKKAYRKLAHRHHPDMSRDAGSEEKFKEIAEAYATLKDPEKRARYDALGSHRPGEEFSPPPEWEQRFGGGKGFFDDVDLSDLFAAFGTRGGRGRARAEAFAKSGQDYEVAAPITLEQAHRGGEIQIEVTLPEYDRNGLAHRVPRTFQIAIPKGAADGQRLRLRGKGGKGMAGGPPGDLYVVLKLAPHPLYRVSGADLYLDLPLAPWEAVLGAKVEISTLEGDVELHVKPGTVAGQKLRLSGRGMPTSGGGKGSLYAVVRIEVPPAPARRERELFEELAKTSDFHPRAHFAKGARQ